MFTDLKLQTRIQRASIAWLPPLPEHWGVARGKVLFRREQREPLAGDGVVTCFRDGMVTLRSNRRLSGFTEAVQEHGYQRIHKGDLVIHAMDAFAGAVGVSDSDGKSSPVYAACTPRSTANSHYYAAVVREMARTSWIAALSRGVRERSTDFRFESFANQLLPVPPDDEQAAIVKYLGHAHARIDRAIAAKRKLIALLEEQKQATINQAVTRGLDPSVPMKDSGVPWLGEIPAHWELRKLGQLMSIRTGTQDTVNRVDHGKYPFYVRSQSIERIDSIGFEGEAVLTAGDGAGVGKVFHYVNGPFDYHQRVYKFSDFREVLGRYFFEYFRATLKFETEQGTAKSTVDSLRRPMLKSFPVAVPPEGEQLEILNSLQEAIAGIDSLAARVLDEVSLLREFRTRLTSDVVTGQVDVREIAATLPELADEVLVEDDAFLESDDLLERELDFASADE